MIIEYFGKHFEFRRLCEPHKLTDRELLLHIIINQESIMSAADDLKNAANLVQQGIVDLGTTITEQATAASGEIAAVSAKITDLQNQIGNGGVITAADLQVVIDQLSGAATSIGQIKTTAQATTDSLTAETAAVTPPPPPAS